MRSVISLTIDTKLLDEVDTERDDLPRSRYIERALRQFLAKKEEGAIPA